MREMTESRCEVGVVLSSAASEKEMATITETALERLPSVGEKPMGTQLRRFELAAV